METTKGKLEATLSEPPSSLNLKQAHGLSITFLPKLHHNGLAVMLPSRNFIGIQKSSIRGKTGKDNCQNLVGKIVINGTATLRAIFTFLPGIYITIRFHSFSEIICHRNNQNAAFFYLGKTHLFLQ